MGRPRKEPAQVETLDEFVARVERDFEATIVAMQFPDTDRIYLAEKSGFRVTPGDAKARLDNGDWVS